MNSYNKWMNAKEFFKQFIVHMYFESYKFQFRTVYEKEYE
jgi:hypothetical protein